MALNIKSAEADRLARELAALTGESITEAVTRALEQRLEPEAEMLADVRPEVRAFDGEQARFGFAAYHRYGKGLGHPARLNLGGCAAYALATSLDLPLLFKGDGLGHTDARTVLAATLKDPP
jgi:ribonuclease VapC